MEMNGMPLYIKSSEKGIPYLYDVDTNEHVGYWCQKKGVYVIFSPYMRIVNNLKRSVREESRNSGGKLKEEEEESKVDEEKEEEEEEEEEEEDEEEEEEEEDEEEEEEEEEATLYPTSTIFKFFVLMFVYIMFQKCFQVIYIDFIFAFAFTILYTKIVKTTLCVDL
jgi:Fe2+ transport system protein B